MDESSLNLSAAALHGIPAIGVIVLAAIALHISSHNKTPSALRQRILSFTAFLVTLAALGLLAAFRTRFNLNHTDITAPITPTTVGTFRSRTAPKQLPAAASTYGGTQLYAPVSTTASANYTCFAGDTPLSCAAWFCNMSSAVTALAATRSCEMVATSVNWATKVAAVGHKTCTQSTDARCSTAALTAVFGKFSGVYAAYCTDMFLVILSSGKSRTQAYNLDNIPSPPGGMDSIGQCRTRTASITDQFTAAGIPLTTVALPSAALTNNMNTLVWPMGAVDGGWMKNGNSVEFGIPTAGPVGITITGQQLYPVWNNNGGCE